MREASSGSFIGIRWLLIKQQFVNEDPQKGGDDLNESKENSPAPANADGNQVVHDDLAESITSKRTSNNEVETPLWTSGPSSHPTSQPATASFTQNDESAVAGLLALGTSTSDMMGGDLGLSLSDFAVSSPAARAGHVDQAMTPPKYADCPPVFSPTQLSHTSNLNPDSSPTEILELLRHYRYDVAPWVSLSLLFDKEMRD